MTPIKTGTKAGLPKNKSNKGNRRKVSSAEDRWPLVAIVGRPNVGKSTLFNRLTRTRRSIVGDEPGITRDRIYGVVDWGGKHARLVDTGGVLPSEQEFIPAEIFRQAKVAFAEAAAIIMVVDGRTELAAPDMELARLLLRLGKPLFLAVNKMDADALLAQAENFRRLGLKEMLPVSAEHGLGIGDLLDAVFAILPEEDSSADEAEGEESLESDAALTREPADSAGDTPEIPARPPEEISVAIIGRPNVGKSTLLNVLTGTARAIVSPIAGTTRDAVDEVVERDGQKFRFIDTAGIRRKGKTHEMAEKLSVLMARKHLEAADVSLLVIDATAGVLAADATIGGYAHESGRSMVVVVNKWDLVTSKRTDGKPAADRKIFEEQLRYALKFLNYVPVIFISAAEGQNIQQVFATVIRVAAERQKRVGTGQMNRFLERVDFERAPVPMSRRMRILYMTQASVAPPTFVLFTDRDVKLHFSYERFLENQIREAFGFEGSPIRFIVRARKPRSQR
ncbi:MAG TPA: ribosome biogenesis GTPase Der [Acidobacteriaceae bacterium]|nr:ribosome biogenesis GTPase Der [Acidobacteriaceae bacterium]